MSSHWKIRKVYISGVSWDGQMHLYSSWIKASSVAYHLRKEEILLENA